MRSYLSRLSTRKPVVYTGDLNVGHEDVDIHNPEVQYGTGIYVFSEGGVGGGWVGRGSQVDSMHNISLSLLIMNVSQLIFIPLGKTYT